MSLPSPGTLLGLKNDQFLFWYPGQAEAFNYAMNWYYSPARFLGLSLPTGSGKTLVALLLARLTGTRTCILTATKGLQTQYLRDSAPL
jgi:superfamily II DNA or RNA helicase